MSICRMFTIIGDQNVRRNMTALNIASRELLATFSDNALARIFQVIGTHHQGELRSLFVILSDDDCERCEGLIRSAHQHRPSTSAAVVDSGSVVGPGSGMDLEAGFLHSLRTPPPPPPPLPTSGQTSDQIRSRSPDIRRGKKPACPLKPSDYRAASHSPRGSRHGLKRNRLTSTESESEPRRKSSRAKHSKKKRSRRSPSSFDSDSDSRTSSRYRSPPPRSSRNRGRSRSRSRSGSPPAKTTRGKGH